jgi:prolyl-tRNA editing enzyme YbaK/EbsC (Cys-tRNA(Pro) deacylase)
VSTARTWPEPVERVVRYLREACVEARVEEFTTGTPTAADAARATGARLQEIVKSLVFLCDGRSVLVMVPGDQRADSGKIAKAVGCERVKVAGAEDVVRATGFSAGGVAPFPLPHIDLVLMERTLLMHEIVWIGAGTSRHMAALAPTDLLRLARARPVDAVAENA